MRSSRNAVLAAVCLITSPELTHPQTNETRSVARCAFDGVEFGLYDAPRSAFVAMIDDLKVTARYLPHSEDHAIFIFTRAGKLVRTVSISDLGNPNGWLAISSNRRRFAITWSNAGASGGWNTRVFHVTPQGDILEDTGIVHAVIEDFSARHSCKTRDDNFETVRWMDDDHLLISAGVYPTSDCGREMDYTEGYLLQLSTQQIERRLTYKQLLNLPGICTWNNYPPSR